MKKLWTKAALCLSLALSPQISMPVSSQEGVLDGFDVSSHNASLDITAVAGDFVIVKASGGNGYVNPYSETQAQQTLSSGKLLGFYHFARDRGYEGSAQEEATHFYNQVQGYIGQAVMVLDWEAEALQLGPQWALTFLDTFYSLSGVRCLIYMSANETRVWDWQAVADAGYPLWIAQYADNEPVYGYDHDPWMDDLGCGAFGQPVLRQYTANGYLEGYNEPLDLDLFYGDAGLWMSLAANGPVQPAYAMYRVYNPNSGEHFYTAREGEKDHLVSVGWRYEGIAWNAPVEGEPVYRLYNPNAGDHHYTLSVVEKDFLVAAGWNYEGVGWNTDPYEAVPLYRSYNPNARAGSHHYTVSLEEHQHLISVGWRDEGIAWYGC